ncbi:hypothetical protein ACVXHB_14565 [Escherichia coli]
MELMSSSLEERLTAEPVRFVHQRDMPNALVEVLRKNSRFPATTPSSRRDNYHQF